MHILTVLGNQFTDQLSSQANLGIAELICLKMEKEGVPKSEAYKKIFMMDSRGLLVTSRTNLSEHKIPFAKVR